MFIRLSDHHPPEPLPSREVLKIVFLSSPREMAELRELYR